MAERRAYICPLCIEKGAPTRTFLHPGQEEPTCPTHRKKMVRQPNRPYMKSRTTKRYVKGKGAT